MLSNIVRRAAFALRFGSIDPLISGQVTSKTKVLMERDIKARVEKLAPFLKYDGDPYPVAMGDHTLWVLDGYTTTSMYPYSQSTSGEQRALEQLQLRAQLGQGNGRRVRRHRHLLRVRPEGPDHPGVAQGLPRPLHRRIDRCRPSCGRTSVTRKTCSRSSRTSSAATTSPSRAASTTAARSGWSRPTPGRARCRAPTSAALIDSGQFRHCQRARSRSRPRRRGNASTPTTSTSSSRTKTRSTSSSSRRSFRCRRTTEKTRLVSFLTANSDPGHYGQLRAFTMPQGDDREGAGPGQQRDEPGRRDLHRHHVPEPAGFEGHAGKPAADTRWATRCSTYDPSTRRAAAAGASRSSSSWPSSPRTSGRPSARRT